MRRLGRGGSVADGVGPLSEQGLDETFGFPVGARPSGASARRWTDPEVGAHAGVEM